MKLAFLIYGLFVTFFLEAEMNDSIERKFTSKNYSFARVFEQAKLDVKWMKCKSQTERAGLFRSYALQHALPSNLISHC